LREKVAQKKKLEKKSLESPHCEVKKFGRGYEDTIFSFFFFVFFILIFLKY